MKFFWILVSISWDHFYQLSCTLSVPTPQGPELGKMGRDYEGYLPRTHFKVFHTGLYAGTWNFSSYCPWGMTLCWLRVQEKRLRDHVLWSLFAAAGTYDVMPNGENPLGWLWETALSPFCTEFAQGPILSYLVTTKKTLPLPCYSHLILWKKMITRR